MRRTRMLMLSLLCLAVLIERTHFPTSSVSDLSHLRLESSHLTCLSGCDLSEDVSEVHCLAAEDTQSKPGKEIVYIGHSPYVCSPADSELGQSTQFVVESMVCSFSDEEAGSLIADSCRLGYSLSEPPQRHSDYPLRLLLSFILVSLIMLALRDYITKANQPGHLSLPEVQETVADSKEIAGEQEPDSQRSRREEKVFRQGHSFVRERSRSKRRSRSRRRD